MTDTNRNALSARWLITEALFALLAVTSYDKITVHSIVHKAGISRSTFYLHFLDKQDLLDQLTEQIIGEFLNMYGKEAVWDQTVAASFKDTYSNGHPHPVAVAICEHVRRYEHFYRSRFQDQAFLNRLTEGLRVRLLMVYEDESHASFAAFGTVGYMGRWLMEGFSVSIDDIAMQLSSYAMISLPGIRQTSHSL